MIAGVSAASGPWPMPVRPKLILPVLVTTWSGTHLLPGYAGVKVMGIVQTVPAGLLAAIVQPVILPTLYSCFPSWDCGIVMLVIVSAAVVWRRISCTALVAPTAVDGKLLALIASLRIRLLAESEM